MFTIAPLQAVLVTPTGEGPGAKAVQLPVVKVEQRTFFIATKGNTALSKILQTGMDDDYKKVWRKKLTLTNVFETLKKLKDNKYKEHIDKFVGSKRSRKFRAFLLQLPATVVLHAPEVCDVSSVELRVCLSNLS